MHLASANGIANGIKFPDPPFHGILISVVSCMHWRNVLRIFKHCGRRGGC